eukprot:FR741030.1.p1 GENE.FR741030.1~~FR741030.1.p1  ORF type:complete len:250 (+),score=35.12 FR741030.1:67-750(+)
MIEPDWRTVLKALYMFHMLLAKVEPEDAVIFKKLLDKMGREVSRKSGDRYFSKSRILDIDAESDAMSEFVRAYGNYVLKRASMFTSQFEELNLLRDGTSLSGDDCVAQLLKAKKLLTAMLACGVDPDAEADVTLACLDVVVRDMHVLFSLYDEKLSWVVANKRSLFKQWDEDEVTKLFDHFLKFRRDKLGTFQSFLTTSTDLLELYGSKNLRQLVLALPSDPAYGDL